MSLLAFLGLHYPVKLLPLLLFESTWKLLWLGLVALPKAIDGNLDKATSDMAFNCCFVVLILAVIPWATRGAPTCARPEWVRRMMSVAARGRPPLRGRGGWTCWARAPVSASHRVRLSRSVPRR